MNKLVFFINILFLSFFLISCSKQEIKNNEFITKENYLSLYVDAMEDIKSQKYDEAEIKFKKISINSPLSNEGIQSQTMLAFIDYISLRYQDAIFKFSKIIRLYPSYKNIDYVYYMIGICYFEQINNEEFDGFNNQESFKNFQEVINRFPNSEYAKDSKQKIIFINENIAAKNMNIAMFYLKNKKYLAAMGRYNLVIENFSSSKFTPEALYRLVEVYYILGMKEQAKKTASVIVYNYPNSKWYRYAYNLVNDKPNKSSLSNKFLNIFNKDESE